jgi:hypothetical protein
LPPACRPRYFQDTAENGGANPLKKFESLSVPFRRGVAYTKDNDAPRKTNAAWRSKGER